MEIGIVKPIDIESEMKGAYLDYAMSVITARALPDVRDGLKPVQRRILYAMFDMGLRYDRPYKKSARVVGECLGKYHPHGDSAVYDAMVRLAQDFSMRYQLVDGQGNFGCFTGDTKIKLLDGTEKTFAELAELDPTEVFFVYAVDQQGRIVVGEGRHARITRQGALLVEVVLDNGAKIRCTPDHRFMLRDGTYKEAQYLTSDDSLMPGYFDSTPIKDGLNDYLRVLQPVSGEYEFVHHLADAYNAQRGLTRPVQGAFVRHHKNFNRLVAGQTYNHRVIAIRWLDERTDVYDITVDEYHNFLLAEGVFVHNSVDGDPPAAMRYTEARLARISEEMVADINKNTVDFYPNFDDTLTQPTVLPANLPNLLVNGASGIAVGMATNIPPHNLNEIADACMYMIDRWDALDEISVDDLMKFVHGPDFPTGATVMGIEGIRNAYATGRGRLIMRAKAHIEDAKGNRQRIVVTELPYQVNKATLVERIADLVRNKKIDTISDLRDESDRRGMSVVIELKRGANPKTTLNQLLKHTQLQGTFGVNILALVNGEPRVLPLKRALELWVEHRREVIRRRTEYDLERARARAHILEGLRIALEHLDEVIQIIRQSQTRDTAKTNLIKRFKFSEMQAQAILDMQLGRLAALERKKIEDEYRELIKLIGYLEDLLANPRKILLLIKEDLKALKERYGDARRTRIMAEEGENFSDEDLIPDQEVIITVTERGYIKRVPADTYRPQRRGGRGIMGMTTRDEDLVLQMSVANTHDSVLFFTDRGRVFQIKAHLLPEADRTAKGMPLVNFISIDKGENVTALLPVKNNNGARYLVMATKNGKIKRTELSEFEAVRPSGIIALTLEDGDSLNWVKPTDGAQDILIISANGQALRFSETEVRAMGRTAAGVNAMRLDNKDQIVCMVIARPTTELLIVTRNGFAKRTPVEEYPPKGRATGGVRTIDVNKLDETGPIVTALIAHPDDEVAIMSRDGVVIRTEVKQIKQAGRATRGSRVMTLKKGDVAATVTILTPRLPEETVDGDMRPANGAKKTADDGPPTAKKTAEKVEPPSVRRPSSAVRGQPDADAILAKPSVTEPTQSIKDPKKAKAAEQQALDILLNDDGGKGAKPAPKTTDGKGAAGDGKTARSAGAAPASQPAAKSSSKDSGSPSAGKSVNAVKLGKSPADPPASKPTTSGDKPAAPAKPPTKPKK